MGLRWLRVHTRIFLESVGSCSTRGLLALPLSGIARRVVRQSERSEKTRGKILDAAVRVLVEHGYAATSTTRIVAEAGLSRGAMLHHFPHKAELMQAVLRRVLQVREKAFLAALGKLDGQDDSVSTVMDAFWEAVGAEEAFVPWLELTVAARTDHDLRVILAEAAEDLERVVMTNFRRLFDTAQRPELPELFSDVGISMLLGLAMRKLIRQTPGRTEAVLDAIKWVAESQLATYLRKEKTEVKTGPSR